MPTSRHKISKDDCTQIFYLLYTQTVAATAGLLYNLAINQRAQDKLREEVMKVLPTPHTSLTYESLTSLPYMRACLKESMRVMPVLSGNFRGAGRDMILQGYQIPIEVKLSILSV